jgi:hypothetical protein
MVGRDLNIVAIALFSPFGWAVFADCCFHAVAGIITG